MKTVRNFCTLIAVAATLSFLVPVDLEGVPAYTRQTGMTCMQCHTSFGAPVPNFTYTGKKFRINGYRMPYVADKIEAGQPGVAGGKRLTLPRIPYIAFRYQNVFLSQRKSPGATEAGDLSTAAPSRLSFFPAGALGDNIGMWAEMYIIPGIGFPGQEWSLGTISFEEWDLRYTVIEDDLTFGFGINNQSIGEIGGFGPWPIYMTSHIGGGSWIGWAHPNRASLFTYGFFNDQVLAVLMASPGEDDFNWNNGSVGSGQLAWAPLHSDNSELWFAVTMEAGSDGIPLTSSYMPTAEKTWRYVDKVDGLSDLRAGVNQGQAYVSDDIGDFVNTRLEARYGFMYKEPHSLETALRYEIGRESYVDNAEIEHDGLGLAVRYLYDFTWGTDLVLNKAVNYKFTDPTGTVHDIENNLEWNLGLNYRPAMNFILNFSFGNSQNLAIGQQSVPSGWSWSLSTDFVI